ncbi:MAG: hypothetical protein H6907_00010 [Hyphomicrobiales bacterium]|nr:hypothetical protein [Hyphomicrobiales bacterium]
MRTLIVLAGLLALQAAVLTPNPVAAQARTEQIITRTIFTELERRVVRDYYLDKRGGDRDAGGKPGKGPKEKGAKGPKGNKSGGLPPGLAKRDSLPPGLARKLDRDGRLPPGLEKRDLPGDLDRRLPPPPKGTHRAVVDGHVVLIETATNVLLDVIEDAIRGAVR